MKKNQKKHYARTVLLLCTVLMISVSCKTTTETIAKVTEPTVQQVVSTEPSAPQVEKTEPSAPQVEKTEASKPQETTIVAKEGFVYEYDYEYAGYTIKVEAHDGYGYVTYPEFITDAEIMEALKAFAAEYGDFGVTYEKTAPGKLEVKYPENLTKADFDSIAAIAAKDLTWYLGQMFAPAAESSAPQVKVTEPVVAEKAVEAEDFKYEYVYEYAGYSIKVEAHDGYGYVTYPEFITDAEIMEALKAFAAEYGDFGVTYEKTAPGKLEVKYPKNLTKADFDSIAAIAAKNLTWYLGQMFAPAAESSAPQVKVTEVVVSEPAVVEPVVIEKAVQEEVKEVAKTQTSAVEQPKAAVETKETAAVSAPVTELKAEKKKGMSPILVILIILVVLVLAFVCYFCLYRKLSIKEAVQEIKKRCKK